MAIAVLEDVRHIWSLAGRLARCPHFLEHHQAGDALIAHALRGVDRGASGAQETVHELLRSIEHLAEEAEVTRCSHCETRCTSLIMRLRTTAPYEMVGL